MIERIVGTESELALILRGSYSSDGIAFFTPSDNDLQLGYMKREGGYIIKPHLHQRFRREIFSTQEVLYIKSGLVRVDFYDTDKSYVSSETLGAGDVILLVGGGHGFEILDDAEIIEVKQGPYAEDKDKVRFSASDRVRRT